jgi:hypothetical protein
MEFLSPAWLLLLIPVGLAVVGYFILQLRRKKYVARFSNVSLLASGAKRRMAAALRSRSSSRDWPSGIRRGPANHEPSACRVTGTVMMAIDAVDAGRRRASD